MNDFGIRQFPGNYGGTPPPSRSPQPESGSSKPFLVLLLIIACVVLGVLLAWGMREHGERARLSARNHDVEDAYVFVLAKRSNLASFLTDPRTRLYRLVGRGLATGGAVTVAWQEETRTGLLIGDRVPQPGDTQSYAVWHVGQNGQTQRCGSFRPDPAGTYFEFHADDPADGTAGFRVSLENAPGGAREPGEIAYETHR